MPIALALLVAAPRVLAKDAPAEGPRRGFDFAGAATITAAMLLLVRTVVEAPEAGWGAVETLGGFAVAALLLAAFVAIEQRSAHPLVRLGILRSGTLVRANLGMAAVFGAYVAFQFVGTLYLQQMLGWSPVETALAFLPGGLLVAFGAPRIGPLVDRFGTARIILVGAISFVIGYALFLRIGESLTYATVFLPSMILIGIGFALCFPTLNIQATAGVADHEQGLASGLVNTSFQVGGAIGLAIVTAVVSANTDAAPTPPRCSTGSGPGSRSSRRSRRSAWPWRRWACCASRVSAATAGRRGRSRSARPRRTQTDGGHWHHHAGGRRRRRRDLPGRAARAEGAAARPRRVGPHDPRRRARRRAARRRAADRGRPAARPGRGRSTPRTRSTPGCCSGGTARRAWCASAAAARATSGSTRTCRRRRWTSGRSTGCSGLVAEAAVAVRSHAAAQADGYAACRRSLKAW